VVELVELLLAFFRSVVGGVVPLVYAWLSKVELFPLNDSPTLLLLQLKDLAGEATTVPVPKSKEMALRAARR
jgi:hypothetical protein